MGMKLRPASNRRAAGKYLLVRAPAATNDLDARELAGEPRHRLVLTQPSREHHALRLIEDKLDERRGLQVDQGSLSSFCSWIASEPVGCPGSG